MTKLIQNVFKNHPKSVENGTQIFPKSVKIDKNGALGAFGGILGDVGAPGRFLYAPGHQPGNSKVDFLAKMVAPRVDFETPAGPPGVQNLTFLPKVDIKSRKSRSRRGSRKRLKK